MKITLSAESTALLRKLEASVATKVARLGDSYEVRLSVTERTEAIRKLTRAIEHGDLSPEQQKVAEAVLSQFETA